MMDVIEHDVNEIVIHQAEMNVLTVNVIVRDDLAN